MNYMLSLKELSLLGLLATKKIETLPISFIYSLSLSASKTMDQVYSDLLKLQDDYLLHLERHRRTKKIIDEE